MNSASATVPARAVLARTDGVEIRDARRNLLVVVTFYLVVDRRAVFVRVRRDGCRHCRLLRLQSCERWMRRRRIGQLLVDAGFMGQSVARSGGSGSFFNAA